MPLRDATVNRMLSRCIQSGSLYKDDNKSVESTPVANHYLFGYIGGGGSQIAKRSKALPLTAYYPTLLFNTAPCWIMAWGRLECCQ